MTGSYLNFTSEITTTDIDRILELGSRDGKDALLLRDHFDAEVVAFECNPQQIPQIQRRFANEHRVRLIEKAVWDENCDIPFYPVINGNVGASSAFKANPDYPYEQYIQTETTVPAIRLDDWCRENEFVPDLICMDLQGAELHALRGMGAILLDTRHIITEVQFEKLYEGTPLLDDLSEYLKKWNFVNKSVLGTNSWFGDAIFSRELAPTGWTPPDYRE